MTGRRTGVIPTVGVHLLAVLTGPRNQGHVCTILTLAGGGRPVVRQERLGTMKSAVATPPP